MTRDFDGRYGSWKRDYQSLTWRNLVADIIGRRLERFPDDQDDDMMPADLEDRDPAMAHRIVAADLQQHVEALRSEAASRLEGEIVSVPIESADMLGTSKTMSDEYKKTMCMVCGADGYIESKYAHHEMAVDADYLVCEDCGVRNFKQMGVPSVADEVDGGDE